MQPLQQFRRVGVITELLQRLDLGANRNLLPKDLHLRCAALDGETARARRLEADEQHQVSGIGQAQHQVVQHAAAR